MESIRWGILGTGRIANKFAEALRSVEGAELVAVGSRTRESADFFGSRWEVPRRHASYEALAADPDVHAIYVSTPHTEHHANTLLCLEHGKAVLCEKPFALNAREAKEMVSRARDTGRFLMEGMWTRYHPVTQRVRALLASGAIGEPRLLTCNFGFRAAFDPMSRLFDPQLGGGALLDVGVYCVSYARMVFGAEPAEVVGLAQRGSTGVDEQSAYVLRYESGALAVLSSAIRTQTEVEAIIHGSEGTLRIPRFYDPAHYILNDERHELEREPNGFCYQVRAMQELLRAGELESPALPLDETLEIQRTLDRIRAQWGLRYPGD